ncbi:Dysferlin [Manis pentadactyla]|nr:Dysferlin [Manis pentadactyla]
MLQIRKNAGLEFRIIPKLAVARSGVIPQHSLCSGHRHHDSTGQGHSGAPVTCCRLQAAPRPDQPQDRQQRSAPHTTVVAKHT